MADETKTDAPDVLTSRKASMEAEYRDGEMELVEWVDGLYSEAEKAKDDQCQVSEWDEATQTYWGDQWPESLPSFKAPIVINVIKSLLLQELSDLTDSRIKIYVQKDRTKGDRDKNVEKAIQAFWARQFCDLAVLFAALDAGIYPAGFIQVGWDPMLENGQGNVVLKARDPRSVYPDPDATDDTEGTYLITTDVMPLITIRRMWPEYGFNVKPEAAYSVEVGKGERTPNRRLGSGFVTPVYSGMSPARVEGYKKAQAKVYTVLVDDPDVSEEIQEVQGVLKGVQRWKYPHRRMIQVANKRILYDGPNPYEGSYLTRVVLQPPVHSYWPAQSIVSEFDAVQKAANKSDSMVVENAARLNGGFLAADADSGIDPKTWANIPGQLVLKKPGSQIQVQYPPPMPADMVQMGERLRGFIRETLGFPQSRLGVAGKGTVSSELTETEISQAMGLTRLRGRLVYQSVQRVVENLFRLMAIFYTTPRHLPYQSGNGWQTAPWEPVVERDAYGVHVDESSFQVRSKTMMQRLYLVLARLQQIGNEDLLKMLEIPDAEEVAARRKQDLLLQALAKMKQPKGKKV